MIRSFYWHDYETFGVDPVHDRPSQFAGVRTDADLNIIEDPLVIYCKPADDYLPSPEACLITGITPQKALEDGFPEAEFIAQINEAFSQPGTCVVGYNSLRFDDEVTRHTLYRNLRDPYAREWQNGNSRWDIIDMVRLTYALRPEGINWPRKEDGSPSFRLEELTVANGIAHESAHDAMSDVEATIAVARLIKEKQPKLFDFVLQNKDKHSARSMLDTGTMKPVFHISSKYPASRGCCALVAPVAEHPTNKNLVIVYDLREEPEALIQASPEEIRERVFTAQAELGEGVTRFPLKGVQLNKCPVLAPATMLSTLSKERLAELELDGDLLRANLAKLRKAPDLPARIAQAFDQGFEGNDLTDPDEQLYAGGFISKTDREKLNWLVQQPIATLGEQEVRFEDERLQEMLFRYRARNYPDTLIGEEMERWESFRSERLMHPKKGWRSLEAYGQELQRLAADPQLTPTKQQVLEDLHLYGESLIPYM
ncbi:MAG: exodeoxyribonuclease I [Gammaproteobacteria bacterium]|uniref:Exodeoxyribonuclease I n=1 Tax=Marinobacter nitratireducens TaxID=1137280 RepID=A0A072NF20_9GAMM|nr:exodeoxyribonuclease I [Marinobacter nitratireducens]KEF31675.1 Exodeoxyribonuclease I [Marinobacter nitratireducens]TNE74849.1 MAG: exodeoxyribonuclease I [Gammaproteobacteria bacterium]